MTPKRVIAEALYIAYLKGREQNGTLGEDGPPSEDAKFLTERLADTMTVLAVSIAESLDPERVPD